MSSSYRYFVFLFVLFLLGVTSTATAQTCPCTIWPASSAPTTPDSNDPSAVNVGVKFRSDNDGYITAIRFYKSGANIGPHVGQLWSGTGTLLASATFTDESASGWQQVTLASPIHITAGTTYVASYFAPGGHYAFDGSYFNGAGVDNPPLHALQDGLDGGNGVFSTSESVFPAETYNASNYWVDVVYVSGTTPPMVATTSPVSGATNAGLGTVITATFSEPMNPATLTSSTFVVFDSSINPVSGTVTFDNTTDTATFTPDTSFDPLSSYTATIKSSVMDVFGNSMTGDYSWSFTTVAPPPNTGPGGPILVIASTRNPFTRYLGEILYAEGMNEFTVQDISTVDASTLSSYDVVILGDMQLTSAQASMITTWVGGGGNLIAMHPDKQLASLLGLTSTTGTLTNAYIQVNTGSSPGYGIVSDTIQFHGPADIYALNGASSLATLYSNATTSSGSPAITLNASGAGQAAAFTYDLARSVVYTRQGNPAWSGQDRDNLTDPAIGTSQIRSNDLFYGNASFDPQIDWVNLDKVQIPQADEQQRLLVNLILQLNSNKKPLPRFWYLPSDYKAAIVMTGDDHSFGVGGTAGRFDQQIIDSDPGCSKDDWGCIRSTSYVFTSAEVPNYLVYNNAGFEIALHPDTLPTSCTAFTQASLDDSYTTELSAFTAAFPGLPAPKTARLHCVLWSDYDSQPKVELNHGIRLDTNYYYWPGTWIQNHPGVFTGSGIPMRFTDRYGNIIDVYQVPTQMTDELPEPVQTYPFNSEVLLDNAIGPKGFYGAFAANMHTDLVVSDQATAIIDSAKNRGVPVISALQMLTWLDGKDASSFGSLSWDGTHLGFTIATNAGARNLRAMIPYNSTSGTLTALSFGGTPVSGVVKLIKGVQYFVFPASTGSYQATYSAGLFSIFGTISGVGGNGATVALSGHASATTTADISGQYSFTGLSNGSYTVTPSKTGFVFAPVSTPLTISGSSRAADFTATAIAHSISGNISGTGGDGVTITLSGAASATTTTDTFGNYTFINLADGSYTVTPSKTGYLFTPADQPVTVSGADVIDINFSVSGQTYTISGTISGAGGNGATVNLTGAATATVTADASGNYTFAGLLNGNYTVTPSKTGYSFSPASQAVTISLANQSGINFATQTYTISGTISGAGGANATVNLTGAATQTITADASGNYAFTGLLNGSYTVTPSKTPYVFTPASTPVTLSNANQTGINFGSALQTYSISGTISGAGGNGATVTLSGTSSATTTADASGNYSFTGLANGSYTVTPSKTLYVFSPVSAPVTINNGNQTLVNFSSSLQTYTISGTISGAGGNGATVTLSGAASATTIADASGNYTFTGLANGSYTVTPSKSLYAFTPTNAPVTINNANQTGVNFTSALQTYTISGTISGIGGNGATVTLSGSSSATTTADASGNYSFTGLANGSYTVTPTKALYVFSPTSTNVIINNTNQSAVDFASTLQTYAISGTVSGAGGNGATVTLSGTSSATTTADASGNYSFTGLANGNYTVTPSKTLYVFTPASTSVTINNGNQSAINFVSSLQTYTISGTISGAGGSGATITLSGAASLSTTADGSGNYSFTGLANGSYSVTPSKALYVFTPTNAPVTINNANQTGVNFTSALQTYTISGTISGPGGNGATVTLSGASSATTIADASGNYSFSGLANGGYTVTPSKALYVFTPTSTPVTISNSNQTGVNFSSALQTYTISGTISGAGGNGATVTLSGAASATTTADASGNYSFTGLANGSYTVSPSKALYVFTPASTTVTVNNGNQAGVDFGSALQTYTISGTISGPGGNSATVTLSGTSSATTTADASGNYSFSGLANGSYTVTPSKALYVFTPTNAPVTINNANQTGVNFTSALQTYTISGTISGAGGNGATVTLSGAASATTTTDGSGNYSFTGLANGSYTVTPSKALYVFTPASTTVTINNGNQSGVNFTSALQTYTISGNISGPGGSGATVTLSGASSATTTADASGNYSFTGLANGNYTVAPSKALYVFTSASTPVTINNGNQSGVNFSSALQTYTISGTISGAGGNGTTVTLSGSASATTTADASGNYSFTGLANGSYTVTPSKALYVFTPTSTSVTINNGNESGVNFSSALQTYSITGTISGAGGNGATVTLSGSGTGTVTADASGNYSFTGLANGSYTVTPTKTGYAFTPANRAVTINNGNQPGINFATQTYTISGTISGAGGSGATVTLTGAATDTVTADASGNYTFSGLLNGSYTVTPSKTGYEFSPANHAVTINLANQSGVNFATQTYTISGTISGTGGNGATVNLTGAASQTVTADASGYYTFSGLLNGNYSITPSKAGFVFSPTSRPVTVSAANVTGINFGTQTYSISGVINGAGGNGATVTLSGDSSATVTADASGNYSFIGLVNGNYTVIPSKTGFVFSPANRPVNVNGGDVSGVNFATETYTISGVISGAGGANATVNLTGAATLTTIADASGNYAFTGLLNGSYTVAPSKALYVFTPSSTPVTISNTSQTGVNFSSALQTYSISGTISGAGGNGATVTLSGTSNATVTADGSGNYTFTGLANGSYTVTPTKALYMFSPASSPVAINNGNQTGVNFTSTLQTYSISGTIGGPGGNGATVTLSGSSSATTTADASGNYSFNGLANGSYTVTPSKALYVFTPTNAPVTINNGNQTGVNFSSGLQTYSISGTISGAGGNGATLTLSGTSSATTTADASGNYSFSGLANGSYTVTPSKTLYVFSPTSTNVTINNTNQSSVNFSSSLQTYTISGTISGAGGNGATVTLSGTSPATTTADASGNYSFTGLANGNYTVTPSKSLYVFTPTSAPVTINNGNQTGINFSSALQSYSITGTISGAGGNGATVTLSGTTSATVTADASGNYSFTGLANGSYTVTPSKSLYIFTPTNASITINNANRTGVNFTSSLQTYTISGTISGAGGNGATVTLSGAASATTTADASGNYSFSGLANGNYTITPTKTLYVFSPTNTAVTINNANQTAINFTSSLQTYSISGTISGVGANGATVALSGASSATTTADASGHYSFTALANGNYTVTPSATEYIFTPSSTPVVINNGNQTANFSSTPIVETTTQPSPVTAGGTATANITIRPASGFTGTVAMSCTGLPYGTACSFNPASPTLSTSAVTSTLTITTTASSPIHVASVRHSTLAFTWPVFGLALVGTLKKRYRKAMLVALALIALAMLMACGGGSSVQPPPQNNGTPVGTYQITVTATAGSVHHSSQVTLVVQ